MIKFCIFFIFFPFLIFANDNDFKWNHWILAKKNELRNLNFKKSTISYLDNLKFNNKVLDLDKKQPEKVIFFEEYQSKVLSKRRLAQAIIKYKENKSLFNELEKKFNISPYILISLWGLETSFGKNTGKFNILNALATLSFKSRRKDFFDKQFNSTLKLIDVGMIEKEKLFGSWAGAMGQTQFMPTTLTTYGVDFNKDGKIDPFNKIDALASGANYLSELGWNNNLIWGEEVNVPNSDEIENLIEKKQYFSQSFWKSHGFILKKNYDSKTKLKLISPKSKKKKLFLVSKNFDKILNWNRSYFFALSIYKFTDQIKNNLN